MDNNLCYACNDKDSHTHECSFCGKGFGIECGCLEVDHKHTDLNLCLGCQEEKDRIINHMTEQLDMEQKECKFYRLEAREWKKAFNKLQKSITNSITV